jgi:uncharacterized protein (TIGR02246 family)
MTKVTPRLAPIETCSNSDWASINYCARNSFIDPDRKVLIPVGRGACHGTMYRRMPATDAAAIHELFQAAFNGRDTQALLALYEPDAVFVTGPGASVTGHDAIGKIYQSFFDMKAVMRLETASVLQSGDLALLEGRWVLVGASRDGDPFQVTGTSREVVRRQPDGRWLYAIDDPGVSGGR